MRTCDLLLTVGACAETGAAVKELEGANATAVVAHAAKRAALILDCLADETRARALKVTQTGFLIRAAYLQPRGCEAV